MQNPLRQLLRRVVYAIIDTPTPEFTPKVESLARELKKEFQYASETSTDNTKAHSQWETNLKSLVKNVINKPLNDFLRWDVITHTMFATNSAYIRKEYAELKHLPDWKNRWKPLLIESKIGHPIPFALYPKTSGNKVHQAYSLSKMATLAQIEFDKLDTIVEFGGGYGLLSLMTRKLGFKGKYAIYDLPQFSKLQRFYLNANSVNTEYRFDEASGTSTACLSTLDDLDNAIDSIKKTRSLFIANWSLSEAPFELRKDVLRRISFCDTIFIAYQSTFRDMDNNDFFSTIEKHLKEHSWKHYPIPHLGTNQYLTGYKLEP